MGLNFLDQFTYLHFASGIIAYFWGFTLTTWIIIHTIFEIMENTPLGMRLINRYIPIWPGNKPSSDSFINSVGDTMGGITGWVTARAIDYLGAKRGWYNWERQQPLVS
jgi:hypothetical protein